VIKIRSVRRILPGVLAAFVAGAAVAQVTDEKPFLAEMQIAMDRMMAGMEVKPSGDVDKDFVAMMLPHHQGAIDMSISELRHGKNEQLRRIAQEIIVDQQQEIAAMNLALGQPLPPSVPAPTQGDSATMSMPGMPTHHAHHQEQ
jgi:hypothetical protein